jgi:sulfur-oxidizing protein SoxX
MAGARTAVVSLLVWGVTTTAFAQTSAGSSPAAAPDGAAESAMHPASDPATTASTPMVRFTVNGDAIDTPLTAAPGDAARGRAIVANRRQGLCLLCHAGPIPEERFQGNLAPDLAGAGARWSAGQLRLRMVDARRLNPESIMPAYYRTTGLTRVPAALRDKPILSAQQIEDVVAYLKTLDASGASNNPQVKTK